MLGAGNDGHRALAEGLGVADRVRFLGYRVDVERVYQAADIFVLPTAYETFCRAAHEAAACGLPVVAPPVPGIRELIGEDEAGILAGVVASARAGGARRGSRAPGADGRGGPLAQWPSTSHGRAAE